MKAYSQKAFTIVELVVVILILSLLASIAMGTYSQYVRRAKFAAAAVTIQDLSVAIERYEVDLGTYPPSSSVDADSTRQWVDGCDNLVLALRTSMSGDPTSPGTVRWRGPYFNFKEEHLGIQTSVLGLSSLGASDTKYSALDPWNRPFNYISSAEYSKFSSAEWASHEPFVNEVYINPSTFQIFSLGPDGVTRTTTTLLGRSVFIDSADQKYVWDDINNF